MMALRDGYVVTKLTRLSAGLARVEHPGEKPTSSSIFTLSSDLRHAICTLCESRLDSTRWLFVEILCSTTYVYFLVPQITEHITFLINSL